MKKKTYDTHVINTPLRNTTSHVKMKMKKEGKAN